ncbi:putative SNF2 family helicase/ATPase [Aspergillus clavatus NRRL 1]|uniref:SNF2 family helicase/ATPase, putative n=1 Tax=Aspergillus clavatus (strain ATCC 1007 / CBS 513.65 / DSM 816 / NCTC 3887 / NRRL 1 / QM 1276 / 107) TaxID=344612 RepID=A1CTI5_ASPCL|nr:SNF2 family helicase/ATPase, putative [Aspergillus clavatus NRRL 1]EAW06622.1 SNF2 family helicase/ATPase, putative [Aspergillus clavatus NRRL 1]
MAKESDAPPSYPMTPRRPNEQPQHPLSRQPEFGKPSPLGQFQRPTQQQPKPTNHPFNIPKPNRGRPEHHRPAHQARPHNASQAGGPHQSYRPTIGPRPPVVSTPKRNEPFDPFKPVRPSAYNNNRHARPVNNDVVEIRRPENITFTTPRAPKTFYASSAIKMDNAYKNLRNFIDLTNEGGFTPSARTRNTGFGSMDVNGYVDPVKANENIKALLEGALTDEDDKRSKSKKGKKSKNRKNKGKKKQDKEQKKQPTSDIDDLAAQLEGVTVNEPKAATDKLDRDEPKVGEKLAVLDEESEQEEDRKLSDNENENDEDDEEEEEEEEEDEDDGTVEGMTVKLLAHQREGVNWMCDKERGSSKAKGVLPKGGILADDMGLGKTVQAIALMLTNQRSTDGVRKSNAKDDDSSTEDEDEENNKPRKLPPGLSKSTLVVAPLALIKQWESEIAAKVEASHKLRVCVYHGNTRAKATDNLDTYDVVITTYGTLTSEYGAVDKSSKKTGLFSVYWYRIILDEAHTIKNRNAKATQSACALDAEYRWCLSGTPMQNNLDELQSLIKFLRIKPYNDLAAWRDQITRPLANGRGGLAIERLQVYLKAFMKRRTKDVLRLNSNLKPSEAGSDGKLKKSTGFQITKREVIKVAAEFMPGEMNFYKRLEQRTENSLEKMMGGSKMDYAGALVLLLRLRQSCNHPDLVKSDLAKDKDILLQNGATGSQSGAGKQDDLDSMADLFGALSVVSKKCDVCQSDLSKEEAKSGVSRCSECEADLKTTLGDNARGKRKSSHKRIEVDLTSSPSDKFSESQQARARRNRKIVIDSDDEEEEEDGEWIVPEKQRANPNLGKAGGTDDEDAEGGGEWLDSEDSETDDEDGPESPTKKLGNTSISRKIRDSESDSEEDIYLNPGDEDDQVLPSTKIRHLMKILRGEADEHKFIVFSVFTSMLDKIEPFLKRAGIGFARYDGSMRNDHREASLNKLRNNSATRVLLCSLRAGALGLNLTAASRVVILEPFWNPFVEEQAIDRVHRLNQTVDVKIYKMIIKETVEERILELQDRKRELANLTIEGKSAAGKLTMNDMMALFGRDAEARFSGDRGNIDITRSSGLLANEVNPSGSPHGGSSGGSRPWGQAGSQDRNRQPEKRASKAEDPVYGRRW